MNKTELVQAIAEKANLNKTQAKAALDATIVAHSRRVTRSPLSVSVPSR